MKKIILSALLLITLSSCFETKLNSNSLPFLNNLKSRSIEFTINNPTVAVYYNLLGAVVASIPDANGTGFQLDMCIVRVSYQNDSLGGATDNIRFYSNSTTNELAELALAYDQGNYGDKNSNTFIKAGEQVAIKYDASLAGNSLITVEFGSCDNDN